MKDRYTFEHYKGSAGPEDKGDLIGPPGDLGCSWPTGFDGYGTAVRNADGKIVYAHAWPIYCQEFVAEQGGEWSWS